MLPVTFAVWTAIAVEVTFPPAAKVIEVDPEGISTAL